MKKALAPGFLILLFLYVSEGFHLLKLFPFDAGFVNLVLAGNMADSFRFAFNPGEISAGSDSPLYALVLSLFCRLSLDPFAASAVLSKFLFIGCGWLIWRLSLRLAGDVPRVRAAAFVAAAFWFSSGVVGFNMASGLGGLSLAFSGLALTLLVLEPVVPGALLGLCAALAVLSQPAGWILAGLALWCRRNQCRSGTPEDRSAFRLALVAFAVPVLPWMLFCISQNGTIFPNPTAAMLGSAAERPGILTFLYDWAVQRGPQSLEQMYQGLGGLAGTPGWIDFLPWAVLPVIWSLLVHRFRAAAVPALFIVLHLALCLAGTRQTGEADRFFMLDLAFVYVLAALMIRDISERLQRRSALLAATAAVLPTVAVVVLQGSAVIFYQAVYQSLNTQCFYSTVSMAKWVGTNLPSGAVVATYEPGAIRFLAGSRVLDLTGRVEPHVLQYRGLDIDSLIVSEADYVIDPGFMTRLGFSPEDSTLYEPQRFPFQYKLYRVRHASDFQGLPQDSFGTQAPDSTGINPADAP
ncbi:hypothetical protein LLH00_07700 [bacterium]|nr:hypothetical protein [bacterium]